MYVKEMTCSVDLYRKTYISEVVRAEFGRFSLVYVLKGRGMEVRENKRKNYPGFSSLFANLRAYQVGLQIILFCSHKKISSGNP